LGGLLEVRNLSKDFGGLAAVRNVSFDINANEFLGLIGPNGAGKTTLFNLVTGMESADTGTVFFAGKNIVRFKPHAICKLGISRTYQSARPFLNHTVRENILVGAIYGRASAKQTDSKIRVEEILQRLDLKKRESILAKNLPIEERKMVEVGRAIAANPKLLMLDEPMAGLNPNEISRFVELLKSIKVELSMTVLIVEHVMKAISSACSRVIVMHHGEIIAEGTPESVLRNSKVVEVYLGQSYSNQYQSSATASSN
jgi:branched-chain amino acid transport system ATP-binding protein